MSFAKKISFFLVFVFCLGFMTSCFGAGSSNGNTSLSTEEIYKKAVSGIETPMLQQISSDELESLFNLKSSDVDDFTINISMMNVNATEIAIFKFSDKTQETAIDKAIESRLKDLDATWSTYLPDQYELVKDVSKFSYGNVKGYVISDVASKIISNIEKSLK